MRNYPVINPILSTDSVSWLLNSTYWMDDLYKSINWQMSLNHSVKKECLLYHITYPQRLSVYISKPLL